MARKMERLPSLTALRVFEVAARRRSFTRAAEELCVTQAAISHQVKALEGILGRPLFVRLTRRVELTPEGEHLFEVLTTAFDHISSAVAQLVPAAGSYELAVSLPPHFSAKWATPRLKRFRAGHPAIQMRLYHSNDPVDFDHAGIDIAVRWGSGSWPGLEADRLFGLEFAPMCSPDLAADLGPAPDPAGIAKGTLLHAGEYQDWLEWFQGSGVPRTAIERGPIIDNLQVLVHAVIDGQGIGLCPIAFVRDHLDAGRLIQLSSTTIRTRSEFFAIYPAANLRRRHVRAFRDWLVEEAAYSR